MKEWFCINSKKVIITGGCSGLGRGIAQGFTACGAEVLILDIADTIETIRKEDGYAHAIRTDLADRHDLNQAFNKALHLLNGQIDVLINCAGVQRRYPCEDFPMQDWDFVLEVNLNAVFKLCQLAGRVMISQGHGKIINFASMLSYFGGLHVPAYAASKGGISQLTRALAVAWASKGVQVNALAPGYMATEMNSALVQDKQRSSAILSRIPAGRWGNPVDMLGPAMFLASGASDYLNGAVIPVDGGYLSY